MHLRPLFSSICVCVLVSDLEKEITWVILVGAFVEEMVHNTKLTLFVSSWKSMHKIQFEIEWLNDIFWYYCNLLVPVVLWFFTITAVYFRCSMIPHNVSFAAYMFDLTLLIDCFSRELLKVQRQTRHILDIILR